MYSSVSVLFSPPANKHVIRCTATKDLDRKLFENLVIAVTFGFQQRSVHPQFMLLLAFNDDQFIHTQLISSTDRAAAMLSNPSRSDPFHAAVSVRMILTS
jgi:hypothetical protein